MIDGNEYIKKVKEYFSYLVTEFGFKLSEETISGNFFYKIHFRDKKRVISISYENAEDYLSVVVFILQNNKLPDYDDKTKTLHLNEINASILPKVDKIDISVNNEYFKRFKPKSELERKLFKSAKELKLCLTHSDLLKR